MSGHETNPTLSKIIADYREATRAGNPPDRQQLLDQHPDLADDLRAFFAGRDQDKAAIRGGSRTGVEHATLPYTGSRAVHVPVVETSGRFFGDYELLEEIARGGMGVVYRARQVKLNRIVALKMILAGHLAGTEAIQRFYTEAQAAANLDHPGIVPIFEVGQHEGQHFFSMGFVDGQSLAARLDAGSLAPIEAAALTKKIAEAVAFAHQHGVVHRDLKPANVLLDQDGEPVIADFGLAKQIGDDSSMTCTGQILGTPAYMPPEQAAGRAHALTETADVYGIGAILYALLTGRPPFEAQSPLDTLVQVLESETTLPTKLDRRVPKSLELICMRCLEKQPSERYPSADALAQDLDRYLQDEPVEARPADIWQRARRWGRRQPALVAHLVALSMVLTILQITYLTIGTDLPYHLKHTGVLILWGLVAIVLQQVMERPGWAEVGTSAWAMADPLLLTTVLYLSVPAIGPLLIGYSVLITASGLFFRTYLVVVTTLACSLSYVCLLVLRPEMAETPHYCVMYEVLLIVLGGIVVTQVRRIRKLNKYFENQL